MKIAVYGASGHTGRFVVAELLRRGHTPVAIGRDQSKLSIAAAQNAGVETRVASLESADALDKALRGADAVIHCAGPFLDTARPLIDAALRNRVHYFDVTAEQESALTTLEYADAPARERGIFVIPAAGFFGGLGDVLATYAMRDWTNADRIDVAIALNSWWPTEGTRRTGARNTAPRMIFSDGQLVEFRPSAPPPWLFPVPFGIQNVHEVPLTETILMAHHLHAAEIHNYINEGSLNDLGDPGTSGPIAVDERGRSDQRFVIDVLIQRGDEKRWVTAKGRDIYAITAPIVVEAVERAWDRPRHAAGALALAQLVDAASFTQSLRLAGEIALVTDQETIVS